MKDKPFIVYMATNTINGKRYIGATRKGLNGRSQQHFKDSRRKTRDCPRFYDAIRKYGNDAFEWKVLEILSSAEEMYKEEERLIAALNPEYNIAAGGLIFTSKEKQAKFAADRAQRTSKPVMCLNDGTIYPSIAVASRACGIVKPGLKYLCTSGGISRNGLSFVFFTEPMSAEDREKILNERRLSKDDAECARIEKISSVNSRPVTCLTTGIVYPSARVADKSTNLTFGMVHYLCNSGRANRSGHCFSYGELSETERLRLLKSAIENRCDVDIGWKEKLSKKRSRVVICENTNILYDNARSAAKACGLSAGVVYDSCKKRSVKTQSGISFSYLEEWCVNPL